MIIRFLVAIRIILRIMYRLLECRDNDAKRFEWIEEWEALPPLTISIKNSPSGDRGAKFRPKHVLVHYTMGGARESRGAAAPCDPALVPVYPSLPHSSLKRNFDGDMLSAFFTCQRVT